LKVIKASIQGFQANIEYFARCEITRTTEMAYRPLYRDEQGFMVPLPLASPSASPQASTHGRQHGAGRSHTTAGSSKPFRAMGSNRGCLDDKEHRHPAVPLVPMGGINFMPARDNWMKTEEKTWEGEGTQQVRAWPPVMAAVPWPMSEQMQKPIYGEGDGVNWGMGGGYYGHSQEGLDVGSDATSSVGFATVSSSNQTGQVLCREYTGPLPMGTGSISGSRNGSVAGPFHPSPAGAPGDGTAWAASEGQSQVAANSPDATTMLVTNIPNYLTQGALLSLLEDLNHSVRGAYDFFYCPWDEEKGQNLGYAIFDFKDASLAATFQKTWSNTELCRGAVRGQKPLKVIKASLQGFQANIEYFSHVEITHATDVRFRPLYRNEQGNLLPLQLLSLSANQQAADIPTKDGAPPGKPLPEPPPTSLEGPHARLAAQGPRPRQGQAAGRVQAAAKASAHGRQRGSGRPQPATGSSRPRGSAGSSWKDHRNPAAPVVPMGDFNLMCAQDGVDAGQVPRDYWMKSEEAAVEGDGTQQVMTWPVMMTAVPWPMSEQQQKPTGSEGKGGGCFRPNQEGLGLAPAVSAEQVQVPQLMQYMMMPMEAMLPVDGAGHGDAAVSLQHLMPFGGMQMPRQGAWWDAQDDEVYTD